MAEARSLDLRMSSLSGIVAPAILVLIALGIGAVIILALGKNPILAYRALVVGAFGTPATFGETLILTTILTLMALGIVVSLKTSMINLGGPGQEYMGGMLAGIVGIYLTLPAYVHLPLMLLAGFAGGALWALVPAILKAKLGISEIVVCIMMNYIAQAFTAILVTGPLLEPGALWAWTIPIKATARLPVLPLPLGRLHIDFLIAVLLIPIIYLLLSKTVLGYQLTVVGTNVKVAKYAGINITKSILISMIISGGLIGVAGMAQISGMYQRILIDWGTSYGFTAIPVAILAGVNPLFVFPSAMLFGALYSGSLGMRVATGVPQAFADGLTAIILILLLLREVFSRRMR